MKYPDAVAYHQSHETLGECDAWVCRQPGPPPRVLPLRCRGQRARRRRRAQAGHHDRFRPALRGKRRRAPPRRKSDGRASWASVMGAENETSRRPSRPRDFEHDRLRQRGDRGSAGSPACPARRWPACSRSRAAACAGGPGTVAGPRHRPAPRSSAHRSPSGARVRVAAAQAAQRPHLGAAEWVRRCGCAWAVREGASQNPPARGIARSRNSALPEIASGPSQMTSFATTLRVAGS
jgi:hypothetical protein